jgi:6-phosphogluconolactonase
MQREIIRTSQFVADAAGLILDTAEQAIRERGVFRIALSGGNTPRPVYAQLAKANVPWDAVRFTFGDERCVPPDDAQSNYRMAREALFEPANVPNESILRVRGEIEPGAAAIDYEQQLDRAAQDSGDAIYRHDLLLLGIGDDGHTASLFPGTTALQETQRRVVANFVPKFESWRVTFTYTLINSARHVCFLVNASKHRELVGAVLAGDEHYPSAHVRPNEGRLTWVIGETN